MSKITKKRLLLLCIGLLVFGASMVTYYLFAQNPRESPPLDPLIRDALIKVSYVSFYSQEVSTRTHIADRTLEIEGIYIVDAEGKRFASFSTTTLHIKGDTKPHIFSHQDLAMDGYVYLKVATEDPLLKSSIQTTGTWRTFKNDAIPTDLSNVAVAGPIQDNLQIFSKKGVYLTAGKKIGIETQHNTSLLHYRFSLSDKAFVTKEGPVKTMADRLGKDGTVDVWVSTALRIIDHFVFTNALYVSTTTVSNINTPTLILQPPGPQQQVL